MKKFIPIAKPIINEKGLEEVIKVLRSGRWAQGPKIKEFEEAFARYIGVKHAIAMSNGSFALQLGILSCGVKPNDEIITTPFSFIASSNSILYSQAKPVFADIDPKTFNLNPEKVNDKITPRTKAILLVHLYGQPCNMDAFREICEDKNLILIEDACQAHGAEFEKKKVGSFGKVGCFSFYATKNLTTGEGGMVVTDSDEIANMCRLIRNHGQEGDYFHPMLGFNFRITEMQAAIGVEQLRNLDAWNEVRYNNASYLTNEIEKVSGIVPPFIDPRVKHAFHQFTVRVTKESKMSRDELHEKMVKNGIEAKILYPIPIHKQPVYQKLGYNDKLPEAELAAKEVLSLPVHPLVSKKDLDFIIEQLK
jgi:perosamine synthetase